MNNQDLLRAIKCPFVVNLDDRSSIIQLITWLEDRKIREYVIEEREKLRTDSDLWDSHFSEYMAALGCPIQWNPKHPTPTLSWLISCAIAMEYEDVCSTENNNDTLALISEQEQTSTSLSSAVADSAASQLMDEDSNVEGVEEDVLTAEIDKLAALLGLTRSSVVSSASSSGSTDSVEEDNAALLIRCNREVRLRCAAPGSRDKDDMTKFPLGFDTGDAVVNQAAVVLKMLYLFDFRELQDDLNNLIMLGQEYTANPKTNQSLGKVGF